MLPFGLIVDVFDFFLRCRSSIFHGGKSECKCNVGVNVVLEDDDDDDDDAMVCNYPNNSIFSVFFANLNFCQCKYKIAF